MNLAELVVSYGEHNSTIGALKKICDSENSQIKELMQSANQSAVTAGGWTATLSFNEKETVNTDKMLEILKADWVSKNGSMECPYIKTKEYLDMDALEEALYADEIDLSTVQKLSDCRTVVKVPVLRCKKAKNTQEES